MNELDVAEEAARAAGRVIVERSERPLRVDHKGRIDLVTEVDRACEAVIRGVLAHHTPSIPVMGEERGGAEDATTRWVVDPLDGTTNFVHGYPSYGVSVALEVEGVVQVGVVLDPIRRRLYAGRRGGGSTCDGVPLRVSEVKSLREALLGTGFPFDRWREDRTEVYLAYFREGLRRSQGVRRAGACALDLAMLASGAIDAFWEIGLHWWDVAAGVLLVEEAGGRVSSLDGGPLDPSRPCPLVSNGWLHDEMYAWISTVRAAVGT